MESESMYMICVKIEKQVKSTFCSSLDPSQKKKSFFFSYVEYICRKASEKRDGEIHFYDMEVCLYGNKYNI